MTMTMDQIADELRAANIRVGLLRSQVSVARREMADGSRLALSVTVRVSDPTGSGSSSSVTVTPETYGGVEAVRVELARQVAENRRGTQSRIRAERVHS
jgi:hypothetical protein